MTISGAGPPEYTCAKSLVGAAYCTRCSARAMLELIENAHSSMSKVRFFTSSMYRVPGFGGSPGPNDGPGKGG